MRQVRHLALALPPATGWAQEVQDCDALPSVADLIEPREDTAAALAEGAVRLAVLEGEDATRRLLVLTPPPPALAEEAATPPPERLCRIVAEGALGFADLDLAGLEDSEAAIFTVRVPALGFVPESTELLPRTLVLTLGVADGSLAAAVE